MTRWQPLWLLAGLGIAASSAAQEDDEDAPDLAFLEYLGSWQESDEEWLMVAEEILAEGDPETDAATRDAGESAGTERKDTEDDDED